MKGRKRGKNELKLHDEGRVCKQALACFDARIKTKYQVLAGLTSCIFVDDLVIAVDSPCACLLSSQPCAGEG